MTPTELHVLSFLRNHAARHDRVLMDAITSGTVLAVETVPDEGWRVHAQSKRGVGYRVVVVAHPVTGEPTRYYRESSHETQPSA